MEPPALPTRNDMFGAAEPTAEEPIVTPVEAAGIALFAETTIVPVEIVVLPDQLLPALFRIRVPPPKLLVMLAAPAAIALLMVNVVAAAPDRVKPAPFTVMPRLTFSVTLLVVLPSVVPFSSVIESAVTLPGTAPNAVSVVPKSRP